MKTAGKSGFTPMTQVAASRIQSAAAKSAQGVVRGSFTGRAQGAAVRNAPHVIATGSKK